jgi:hypothetical protein
MFLMRYTHRDGSARVSLRNLDAIPVRKFNCL